jgi:hypothetical protein
VSFGPNRKEGNPSGIHFRLELEDGTPAEPPTLHTAVPNWQAGDTIPLGADRTLVASSASVCEGPRSDLP